MQDSQKSRLSSQTKPTSLLTITKIMELQCATDRIFAYMGARYHLFDFYQPATSVFSGRPASEETHESMVAQAMSAEDRMMATGTSIVERLEDVLRVYQRRVRTMTYTIYPICLQNMRALVPIAYCTISLSQAVICASVSRSWNMAFSRAVREHFMVDSQRLFRASARCSYVANWTQGPVADRFKFRAELLTELVVLTFRSPVQIRF